MKKLIFSLLSLMVIFSVAMGACAKPAPEAEKPIKIGHVTVMSGAGSMVGEATSGAVDLAAEQINERGGILGRKLVVIRRDTGGSPEKGVKIAKDFIAVDKVDLVIAGVSSRTDFALKEVSRDAKFLISHIGETSAMMSDPAEFNWYSVRTGRQGVHDLAVGGYYTAKLAREKGWTKFMGLNQDYAYGHEQWELFKKAVKYYMPEAEFVGETWPKVFEPDMTPNISALLAAEPDAFFSSNWGPDKITLIKQGIGFDLFKKIPMISSCAGEYMIVKFIPEWPEGIYSVSRYLRAVPNTKINSEFYDAFYNRFGRYPYNWTNTTYTGMLFFEAAANKAGTLDHDTLIKTYEGLTIKAPWGAAPDSEITIRAQDHSVINYAIAWGRVIGEEPYLVDTVTLPWDDIIKFEQVIWKDEGWIK